MKSKIILILALLIYSSINSYSQDWVWGIKASGDNQYGEGTDIAIDHEGNIVIAGYYELGLNLDTFSLYTDDDYYSDIYLCRMDSGHNVQWLKHIETGSTYDYGIGVNVDDDKNIYLTGGRNGKIFVSKYDSLGNELWLCDFNSEFYGHGNDLSIDQSDNVYITGKNGGNTFLSKLDYYGNPIWVKKFTGCNSNGCHGNDITVDELGNIYLAGAFQCDSLFFDTIKIENKWSWGEQTFVTKISSNGEVLWAKTPIGTTNSIPQIVLCNEGFYLSTTVTTSTIDFGGIIIHKTAGGNSGSPFIAKYDTNGQIVWAKIINTYHGGEGTPRDIVTDLDDNIYLVGQTFGNYGGTEMDFYIEKYNSLGDLQWNKLYQTNVGEYAHGIGIDNSTNAYIVGYSQIKDFIGDGSVDWPSSLGVAKLNTNSQINLRPYRPIINRLNIVCEGEEINNLFADGINIKWYNDPLKNELIYESDLFNPMISETDTFYVTQTINNFESWPKEVIIHFSELSTANLTVQNDTVFASNEEYYSYQWLYNGDTITNATNNYLVVDTIENYSVIISEGLCSVELNTNSIITSLEDIEKEDSFVLYPNPTKACITLALNPGISENVTIQVASLSGKIIYNKASNSFSSQTECIDLGELTPGIYLVRVIGDNINETIKIIKE